MVKAELFKELDRLRVFYNSGKLRQWDYRIRQLRRLRQVLTENKSEIYAALQADLNKSVYESSMAEYGLVMSELALAEKKLKSWMKPKRVRVSLPQMPGSAWQYPESYGVVLIFSPWNYPLQLSLNPLIGAIAAGNCVVLKPSKDTPQTSQVLKKILSQALPQTVLVVEGGREENEALFESAFDYIFFTGSTRVGRVVMESAAKHLTPVTLELGGKSPAIVHASADVNKTAKRLLFGKLLNAGQTCVAPDFVWVDYRVKDQLVEELTTQAKEVLSDTTHWVRIINEKHRQRLKSCLANQTILWQQNINQSQGHFPLTIVDEPSWESPLMMDEIFGPILPILGFSTVDELISKHKQLPKPLALYIFSRDSDFDQRILGEISYGGGCINDTLMHLTSSHLPFGGVGASGMGQYHGKASFDTFTHYKGVLNKSWWFDIPIRHMPYKRPDKEVWLRLLK